MKVSIKGKKVVVYDIPGIHARQNKVFEKQSSYSGKYLVYLYEECLKRGIQLMTSDVYFSLSQKPKRAICVRLRPDIDMRVSLALRRAGVKLALIASPENPFYGCRFYWDLKRLTSYFDHSEVMSGVKNWVSPKSKYHPWYTPHAYWGRVREVRSDFRKKKFLILMQSNIRANMLRRLYVDVMNFIKPMPNFENREGYKSRLDAVQYFSRCPDFDLYGYGWDRPVRYTRKYDEAIRKSYRGSPDDKFEVMKQYKFSICFENSHWGGYVQYLTDSLYSGAVPVYWGAPDIADIFPANCFIDFRKFNCDYARLDKYLRNMDESEYNEYIKNINAFISSPRAYESSQEKYAIDTIKLFESYF